MAISQARMTLEELLRLPDEVPALEYCDGRVTQKVSPKGPHDLLQLDIGSVGDQWKPAAKARASLLRGAGHLRRRIAGP